MQQAETVQFYLLLRASKWRFAMLTGGCKGTVFVCYGLQKLQLSRLDHISFESICEKTHAHELLVGLTVRIPVLATA